MRHRIDKKQRDVEDRERQLARAIDPEMMRLEGKLKKDI